ncbi:MAG TPA: hypothetical protein VJT73_18670 [Polyangiaceae bacterium]|nr:hypothetical protein [Polyangiaceae bacterium]
MPGRAHRSTYASLAWTAAFAMGCSSGDVHGDDAGTAGKPRVAEEAGAPDAKSSEVSNGSDADRDGSTASLGRVCAVDADCTGLACVKASDSTMAGGGPAHGYCSTPCSLSDDPICAAIGGKCLDFSRKAGGPPETWCVQICQRGGAASSLDKCHARRDVACTAASVNGGVPSGDGYCLPTCNADLDCGPRHCDPLYGVCVDAVSSGAPTGTSCAAPVIDGGDAAPATMCSGSCLSIGSTTRVCAQRCAYQSPDACHLPDADADGGIGAYSACLFVSSNTGPGDEAHCGQLCDSVTDCLDQSDPGVYCDKSDAALKAFGHGFCNWDSSEAEAGLDATADGE